MSLAQVSRVLEIYFKSVWRTILRDDVGTNLLVTRKVDMHCIDGTHLVMENIFFLQVVRDVIKMIC